MIGELLLQLLKAFLVGGGICLIGQLLFDVANLTPAHTMSILVIGGSILSGLGVYPLLADFAGFGAMLPISSFGNTLVQGARAGAESHGFFGIFSGLLKQVSAGISAAVIFGFLAALFFKPKS
ncbi:MAG: stage V sporulation protein AE [Clostridia bacterium]|nr:stage V sporulation protein AE [Clostridia bacterium]